MRLRVSLVTLILAFLFSVNVSPVLAQQKPQWQPGQEGLNAGILPSPGFTYANLTLLRRGYIQRSQRQICSCDRHL